MARHVFALNLPHEADDRNGEVSFISEVHIRGTLVGLRTHPGGGLLVRNGTGFVGGYNKKCVKTDGRLQEATLAGYKYLGDRSLVQQQQRRLCTGKTPERRSWRELGQQSTG